MIALRPQLNNRSDHFPPQTKKREIAFIYTTTSVLRSSVRHEISKAALGLTTYVMSCLKWRGEGAPYGRIGGRRQFVKGHTHNTKKQKTKSQAMHLLDYIPRESRPRKNVRAITRLQQIRAGSPPLSSAHTGPPMADPTHPAHTENRETGPIPRNQPTNQPASFAVTKKHTQQPTTTRVHPCPSIHPSIGPTYPRSQPATWEERATIKSIKSNPILSMDRKAQIRAPKQASPSVYSFALQQTREQDMPQPTSLH